MKIVRTLAALRTLLARAGGRSIGFVPTLGDLHAGHLSLIARCGRENGLCVLSVFVNPIQFDRKDDLKKYRRDLKRDAGLAARAGADILFAPGAKEIYPDGFQTRVQAGALSRHLCGPFRPGHFDGVATVVLKLFNIVRPHRAYFGMKDYQQLKIVEQLVKDFHLGIRIIPCAIVREKDGLALSSRNRRLSAQERGRAPALYRALCAAAALLRAEERVSRGALRAVFFRTLRPGSGERLDYFALSDPETLAPLARPRRPALLAAALWLGHTRLIDNVLVK